jgi:uncharacterized protein YggE
MKTKIIITSIIALLILVGCSTPASLQNGVYNPPTISVTGTGKASAVPDIVDIQLGVETVSNDPAEAVSENTTRMNAVMAVLDDFEIPRSAVQTVYYNMWIEDVVDENYVPTGDRRFHVTNQINIRSKDLTGTGDLIQEAISAGATMVAGVTFGIEDPTELEQSAMDEAIANAGIKAGRMTEEIGVTLGSVRGVVQGGSFFPPVPYYGEKGFGGGGVAVPISEGQFSVTVQVQVIYELIP